MSMTTRQSAWDATWGAEKRQPRHTIFTHHKDLLYKASPYHSQFGEDAIIERIVGRIGGSTWSAFECGAGDGVNLSNTCWFARQGYTRHLVECDDVLFNRLHEMRQTNDNILHERVTRDNINEVLAAVDCPGELDIFSLDIDGDDYGVWNAMLRRPRIVCVEFGLENAPPPSGEGEPQAGLDAMLELSEAKGYVPVAWTYCNLIAVREDLWPC